MVSSIAGYYSHILIAKSFLSIPFLFPKTLPQTPFAFASVSFLLTCSAVVCILRLVYYIIAFFGVFNNYSAEIYLFLICA